MPNETLIRVAKKVADEGAIAVGPFLVGKAYLVPADAVALLGDKFETATLAKDEQPVALGGHALQFIDDRRAAKRAADEARAAAKAADAAPAQAVADKSTPAVAGNVTGV